MSSLQMVYLVVRSDGDVRVAKRPRIAADEVAIAVNIRFPAGWGQIVQTVDVQMPEPPTAEAVEPVVSSEGDRG